MNLETKPKLPFKLALTIEQLKNKIHIRWPWECERVWKSPPNGLRDYNSQMWNGERQDYVGLLTN